MPYRDLIVAGASAGGIEALQEMVGGLPPDLPASVLVVVHMPPTGGRALHRILSRATSLDVVVPAHGDPLEPGRVYVAPGDHHLLVGLGHVHLRRGPRENGYRPAVDPLFRSAAAYYGPRAIGVVLSGSLSDGTAGLFTIRRHGGLAVVQDPDDAMYDGMPTSALEYVGADAVAPARAMGPLLGRLASEAVGDPSEVVEVIQQEVRIMEGQPTAGDEHPGQPSPWPCPDCNGVLWEIDDGPILRFRCRVGHAWTAEALLEQQGEGVEGALWMALRTLEDRAALIRKLAERAEEGRRPISASRYRDEHAAIMRSVEVMRRLLTSEPAGYERVAEEGNQAHG
jgi:two-component system chemotaxis response regulator CheB